MLDYRYTLKKPSQALRNTMTDAERLLWSRIRCKQLLGIQFYRQKPIGPYIVDFYGSAVQLVIEVDGSQHFEDEHRKQDEVRDCYLADAGLRVLRFDNLQVLRETDAVVERIFDVMQGRLRNPPCPPFSTGGV